MSIQFGKVHKVFTNIASIVTRSVMTHCEGDIVFETRKNSDPPVFRSQECVLAVSVDAEAHSFGFTALGDENAEIFAAEIAKVALQRAGYSVEDIHESAFFVVNTPEVEPTREEIRAQRFPPFVTAVQREVVRTREEFVFFAFGSVPTVEEAQDMLKTISAVVTFDAVAARCSVDVNPSDAPLRNAIVDIIRAKAMDWGFIVRELTPAVFAVDVNWNV